MATVTIRNLSEEVVAALKERARQNSRSMEAEARELLTRLSEGEEFTSGVEMSVAGRLPPPRRWSVPADEIMAWVDANPASAEEKRAAAEWADEIYRQRDDDPIVDPWERRAAS